MDEDQISDPVEEEEKNEEEEKKSPEPSDLVSGDLVDDIDLEGLEEGEEEEEEDDA